MTRILVTGCYDPHRWYYKYIGWNFPYLGDRNGEYKTRQPDGYLNFIQHEDAELIEVED